MSDAELQSRQAAYDRDGRLIAWTPEAVGLRMVEAASVVARTPARVGPKAYGSAWPQIMIVAQDLVDEETQQRLMRFPHLVGDWESRIDDKTKRHLSRAKQEEWERAREAPGADAYSRAEEALLWPGQFLGDSPLLADALTLWALCIGTGASLRATLRERCLTADRKMRAIGANSRQAAIPDKNFDRRLLRERRKAASALICERLNTLEVAVREADAGMTCESEE